MQLEPTSGRTVLCDRRDMMELFSHKNSDMMELFYIKAMTPSASRR